MTNLDWLMDIIDSLRTILTDDGIVKWLDTPMQKLNWATPLEVINTGRGADVLAIAQTYREPVY